MRQIKFRAWDTEKKEMAEVIRMSFTDDEITLMDSECGIWTTVKDYIAIPMQYTGLTDKNGIRIYEGDIVEFDDSGEEGYEYKEGFDFKNRAVIIWNNGRFELDSPLSDNSEVLDFMNNCHEDFWNALKDCKIIGNIYENQVLLNSQN